MELAFPPTNRVLTTSVKITNLLNEDGEQQIFGDIMKRSVIGELKVGY